MENKYIRNFFKDPARHQNRNKYPDKKTTKLEFRQVSKVFVSWLKTDTKFPGKVNDVYN